MRARLIGYICLGDCIVFHKIFETLFKQNQYPKYKDTNYIYNVVHEKVFLRDTNLQ